MTTKLCIENLGRIEDTASVPSYDRAALSRGILHFGVGNFHRAHQAVYLDALFNTGKDQDWAIVGASVMSSDEQMRQMLEAQDYLTTVVEQTAQRSEARVTGAMVEFLAPGNRTDILAALVDPAIRIVSLTITEGGYFVNPASGMFDPDHAAIVADGASPDKPLTVFGLIVAGLRRRRAAGVAPFTVMSCDNVPHNGIVARNSVTGLAQLSDPDLALWIESNVAFPNGMVDRITPATGARERKILAQDFAIEDTCPVFCEDFTQWVLEDKFTSGRPALETVGVQFVPDVTPYEHMKIRILNGGHALIAYPAGLLGIEFTHEAMEHELVRRFLEKVERDEIIPVLPPVPNTNLGDYFALIEQRFANPKIGDTVRRLCFDGSNRQPKFIIPSITDRLRMGGDVIGLALASALWCRYCYGDTEDGQSIEANDPSWDRLVSNARAAHEDPMAWLSMEDIYGEVGHSDLFQKRFSAALKALWDDGVQHVVSDYLEGAF